MFLSKIKICVYKKENVGEIYQALHFWTIVVIFKFKFKKKFSCSKLAIKFHSF